MRKFFAANVLVALLALFSGGLSAEESGMALSPQVSNGIPYLSGGIGDEETEQISRVGSQYNLKLVLAEKSGSYIAEVKLVIFNAKGSKVLDVSKAGPLVLTKLPVGAYQVSATYEGKEMQQRVDIRNTSSLQTRVFAW